ncbi:MAG: CSLREA domain-containing protein, partial [Candidatus Bipolaricaulota bacterium]|nr:CSLREA domain-containing protein [Candidatus Bipolaricaulota bacterium]
MMWRGIALAIAAIALWSTVGLGQATITVTTTADENGNNNGDCSLREAIIAANANSNAHESGCAAGVGMGDVIVLPAGQVFLLSVGQLSITEGVTIQGNNSTIDGQNLSRVFYVNSSTLVTLQALTITRGWVNNDFGGCIYNETGSTLAIQNSIIRECSSQDPGAGGGGLANRGQAALTGVTVENNTAVGFGGGIFNLGQLQVFTSLIRNNTTGAGGGGICNISQVYLEDVFVEDNQAGGVGGGIASILILANPATLDMIRGAIRRNQAIEIGGGLVNGSGWPGLQATARLVDVTVQGNVAIHQNNFAVGGGIANIATSGGLAELELLRVTISANQLDSAPQV